MRRLSASLLLIPLLLNANGADDRTLSDQDPAALLEECSWGMSVRDVDRSGDGRYPVAGSSSRLPVRRRSSPPPWHQSAGRRHPHTYQGLSHRSGGGGRAEGDLLLVATATRRSSYLPKEQRWRFDDEGGRWCVGQAWTIRGAVVARFRSRIGVAAILIGSPQIWGTTDAADIGICSTCWTIPTCPLRRLRPQLHRHAGGRGLARRLLLTQRQRLGGLITSPFSLSDGSLTSPFLSFRGTQSLSVVPSPTSASPRLPTGQIRSGRMQVTVVAKALPT